MIAKPSLRIDPANPDHHLWNNNGTWWLHATLHLPDFSKRRLRASLGTRCLRSARERRDAILSHLSLHALLNAAMPAREVRAA